jgi:hypothetical protein
MRFFLIFLVFTAACGDDNPPKILQTSLPATVTDNTGPFVITAVVTDNRKVSKVNLLMTPDLRVANEQQRMLEVAEEYYQTSIGPFPPGSLRYLIVQAEDADGNRAWYPHPDLSAETGCVVSSDLCWHEFFVEE